MTSERNLLPKEQLPPVKPGDPMLEITINDRKVYFPVFSARLALFLVLPAWLRDSSIPPPEPDAAARAVGFNTHFLEWIRSGFKNLIRLKLGTFMRGIYGPDETKWPQGVKLPKGREDVLPVIIKAIIDYCVTQAYTHPLILEVDDATGLVQGFRLGERSLPTRDSGNAAGEAGTGDEGTTR